MKTENELRQYLEEVKKQKKIIAIMNQNTQN